MIPWSRAAITANGSVASPRRRVLQGFTLAPVVAATSMLSACGRTDTSERYEGDQGYVSGDGVAREIPADQRDEPIDFTAETFAGDTFAMADQRGTVVVLNVWYAGCPPCRAEAPHLQELHEQFAKEATFIGVNVRDDAGPAQAFEETFGITYPSVPDPDAEIMYALRGQVSPNAVPSTVVIDREGRAAARYSGAIDPSVLRAMITTVLAE